MLTATVRQADNGMYILTIYEHNGPLKTYHSGATCHTPAQWKAICHDKGVKWDNIELI